MSISNEEMKIMKRMKCLLVGMMGSILLLTACQGTPVSTTGGTQPVISGSTRPATVPGTQPATIPSTQPGTTPTSTTPGTTVHNMGNLNRNYSNSGLYAENDEWVWFSQMPEYRLSRMTKSGSQVTSFEAVHVMHISLVGEAVYYVAMDEEGVEMGGSLFRMNQDGTNLTKISPVQVNVLGTCVILDDGIYFTNAEDGDRLYRMDLDGKTLTKVNDSPTWMANIDEEWIFYLTSVMNQGEQVLEIHKMRLDGSEDSVLVRPAGRNLMADRGWLYYADDAGSLFRMTYDKAQSSKIVAGPIIDYTIDRDTLYFIDQKTGNLMTSSLDGSKVRELLTYPVQGVQITESWIYVLHRSGRLYRIKADGSNLMEKAYALKMVQPDPPGTPVVEGLGSLNANQKYRSMFVSQGDWLYGIDVTSPESSLFRMKRDGSQRSVLAPKSVRYLNLVGDWLYFIDGDAYSSIARMKIDGTSYGVIHDSSVTGMIVRDGWIYFTDRDQENQIEKIRTDGTELTVLNKGQAILLALEGDWVYWSHPREDNWGVKDIYRTKTDGSEEEMLLEGIVQHMTVGEGSMFYVPDEDWMGKIKSDPAGIYRLNLVGTGKEKILSEDTLTLIGVYKGHVYYYNGMEAAGLYRAKLDGSNRERLIGPGDFTWVHFLDDQILFFDNSTGAYRIMNLDGSNVKNLKK